VALDDGCRAQGLRGVYDVVAASHYFHVRRLRRGFQPTQRKQRTQRNERNTRNESQAPINRNQTADVLFPAKLVV